MKTYGLLDGLTAGLAGGLLLIVGVVAAHAYDWLAWAALLAVLLVAAALLAAVKRGRGLVDGVILRPWQRQLLLAMVMIEVAGICLSPFLKPQVNPEAQRTAEPVKPSALVADSCGRLVMDVATFENLVAHREGTASDARWRYAELRIKTSTCDDSLKNRLLAVRNLLAAWNSEGTSPKIDDVKLNAQLDALPPPVIETPPPRQDAGPDRSAFVPDYAYIPPALLPSAPPAAPDAPATVTIEEKRRPVLEAILRILSGGFSFGGTKITTSTILGQTMQSADDRGRAMLQAMADSVPKDRPDRLAEFWLQLRMLANDTATPADQRQALNEFLDRQGPVPILCDWVLLSVKDRISEKVAARIAINKSRVADFIKSPSSEEWPRVYADVQACVFETDRNHFAAYRPALEGLLSTREEVGRE